ncbi:MAG: hypothetical protein HC886_13745 [Leptolyngbyaceae cyanobacterium SM1_1_3]|nr:hypothetical protein [Leptolyngbyaceae cyanobacterium SM1_1_3]NJN02607.1 hypothetical protein [Leptolyngbyaceae cyanobacterium RM1_1_2]NJO10826.1 hypothetical protein [Leptolyngbyaceae cyanobacterium SL_1_1]
MYEYRVGGSLAADDPTYIRRCADDDLYQGLLEGKFCYVLSARQMGKSSLRLRTRDRLESSGQGRCAGIDMSRIGSQHLSPEQWYQGLAFDLQRRFDLKHRVNLPAWWQQLGTLPPVQKLSQFIEEVLLSAYPDQRLFVFLDEIDSVKRLSFAVGDFFALVRFCYNQRVENPAYRQLTWALFGVATPRNLVADAQLTPFNIGRAIQLSGFSLSEASPLALGLAAIAQQPQQLLAEVLYWTGGQPFLTQKVCCLLQERHPTQAIAAGTEAAVVAAMVRSQLIQNWEEQDHPEHLRTICDRLLAPDQRSGRRLGLYQQVLTQNSVSADSSDEQSELLLAGIVVKRQGRLQPTNPIYAEVFNASWVNQCLSRQRPYGAALSAWAASNYKDKSRLLMGQALKEALDWATDKSLSDLDYRYLSISQEWDASMVRLELEAQEKAHRVLAAAHQKANQIIWLSYLSLGTCLAISTITLLAGLLR